MSRERISGVDTAWLRMDSPTNPMMIVGVMMFAERLDLEAVKRIIAERFLSGRTCDDIRERQFVLANIKQSVLTVESFVDGPAIVERPDPHFSDLADRCAGLNARMWAYYNKRAKKAKCTPLEAAVLFCGMAA